MVDSIRIHTVVSDLFSENAYIIYRSEKAACAIVDPGFDAQQIAQFVETKGLAPAAILNTHGHADHIAGNGALKQRWPECPLIISQKEAPKLTDPVANLSAQFGAAIISPEADRTVRDGDVISIGDLQIKVRETPGHTCGHVVYLLEDESPMCVFAGDVIFQSSIGRTDFPDGDMETLVRSIRSRLYSLPDDTRVFSGHGPPTTIGQEKRYNPFVTAEAE